MPSDLERSEEKLRTILEHAPVMIDSFDREGRCTLWNRECERRLGWTRAEIESSDDPLSLFYPDPGERDRVLADISRADGIFREYRVRARDGSTRIQRWADFELPTGELISVGYDVTERHRAREALRESENRSRALIAAVPDLILRLRSDGSCVDFFPGERFRGIRRSRWLGDGLRSSLPERVAHEGMQALARALATGEHQTFDFVAREEGEDERHYEVRMVASGKQEAVAFVRDVTERRTTEQQLRQAQKLEAVGRLTGGIAHDFNNLLTVIQGNLELLGDKLGPGRDDLVRLLDEARGAASRGARLIRRLMTFSRKTPLDLRATDLGETLTRISTTLRRLLPESIELRLDAGAALPLVRVDPDAVEQIVINLATNALDAMPRGGRLTLRLRAIEPPEREGKASGRRVRLDVSDTGTGMDEATLRRAFDPFFTTKPPEQGSGLGLAIVYGLIEQHQGAVSVESQPGRGTRVTLEFPVAGDAATADPPPPDSAAPRGGTETVLVVEDEPGIRKLARAALEQRGYTVLAAADGREALEILEQRADEIALVVTDLVMPRMSGADLRRKAGGLAPGVRFLLMTGYAERDVPDASLADDPTLMLLHKPWKPSELLARVREVLDREARAPGESPADGRQP